MLGAIKDLFYRQREEDSCRRREEPCTFAPTQSTGPRALENTSTSHRSTGSDTQAGQADTVTPRQTRGSVVDDDDAVAVPAGSPHDLLNQPEDIAAERRDFLDRYGEVYGYGGQLPRIRRQEFSRLDGHVYLDYAGAALYSEQQIQACAEELMSQLLCNPHSAPASSPTAEAMAALRRDTLALLNADGRQYDVVITSGATAALKLVAEAFPWAPGRSLLAHPAAVHNSVLGMRGPALAAGAAVQLVRLAEQAPAAAAADAAAAAAMGTVGAAAAAAQAAGKGCERGAAGCEQRTWVQGSQVAPIAPVGLPIRGGGGGGTGATMDGGGGGVPHHLLVLPAECNVTGDREPLEDVVRHVRRYGIPAATAVAEGSGEEMAARSAAGGVSGAASGAASCSNGGAGRWLVLLDAAKACATAPPDLSVVPADFVVLSYYKIFGHPTGLGALVVRREALALVAGGKAYWGGGTVEVAVADRPFQIRRPGPAGLEDGTPPFTSVAAARHGFAFLARLGGPPAVSRHAASLAAWLAARLGALRHANGAPAAVLYGKWCRRAAAAPAAAAGAGGAGGAAGHGPTVCFNLLRPDGSWVGYGEVGRLAAAHGVLLRTGCFCNPGACGEWLGLGGEDMIRNYSAGHVCWDDHDLMDGRPTGAVRVSLGAVSSFEDVYALVELVRRYFVDATGAPATARAATAAPTTATAAPTDAPAVPATGAPATATATAAGTGAGADLAALAGGGAVDTRCPAVVGGAADTAALGTGTEPARGAAAGVAAAAGGASAAAAVPAEAVKAAEAATSPLLKGRSLAAESARGFGAGGATRTAASGGAAASDALAAAAGGGGGDGGGVLRGILLYPIKSCAAQAVDAWPVGPTGLLFDREWALVDDSGKVLTLKQCPRMALIRPTVDLTLGSLIIAAPPAAGVPPLELPISVPHLMPRPGDHHHTPRADAGADAGADAEAGAAAAAAAAAAASANVRQVVDDGFVHGGAVQSVVRLDAGLSVERVQVCGDTVCSDLVDACHDPAGEARVRHWFARVLGAPCRIVRQRPGARKVRRPAGQSPAVAAAAASAAAAGTLAVASEMGERGDAKAAVAAAHQPTVGFANDGQYLLVSEASMQDLRCRLAVGDPRVDRPGAAQAPGPSPAPGPCPDSARASLSSSILPSISAPVSTSASAAASKADGGGAGGSSRCSGASASPHAGAGAGAGGGGGDDDLLARLRPNLVVAGFPAYAEDAWRGVAVGHLRTDVLGACPRCELLQVDPRVGVRERRSELLLALAQYRRSGGRVQFGVLLAAAAEAAAAEAAAAEVAAAEVAAAEVADSGGATPAGPAEAAQAEAGAAEGGAFEADVGTAEAGSSAPGEGMCGQGRGDEQPGSVGWLRRRFGRSAVLVVGDPVVPVG